MFSCYKILVQLISDDLENSQLKLSLTRPIFLDHLNITYAIPCKTTRDLDHAHG